MTEKKYKNPFHQLRKGPLAPASLQLSVSLVVGIIGGAIIGSFVSWNYAFLSAWDIMVIVFLLWIVFALHGRNADETEELSLQEDPGRALTDVVLVLASIASLAGVGVLLFQQGNASGLSRTLNVSLGIVSVVLSWIVVHAVYAVKYARIYYKHKGGIDFYSSVPPSYSDFAYLAFTIGMTFQISDNNFKTNEFRRTALRHALLSYMFGTVILGSTINLIVGLGK